MLDRAGKPANLLTRGMPQPKPEDARCKQTPKRRKVHTYSGPEPSVEDIEAEFWRIVETPDDVYESLYGQVPAMPTSPKNSGPPVQCTLWGRKVFAHVDAVAVGSMPANLATCTGGASSCKLGVVPSQGPIPMCP